MEKYMQMFTKLSFTHSHLDYFTDCLVDNAGNFFFLLQANSVAYI